MLILWSQNMSKGGLSTLAPSGANSALGPFDKLRDSEELRSLHRRLPRPIKIGLYSRCNVTS